MPLDNVDTGIAITTRAEEQNFPLVNALEIRASTLQVSRDLARHSTDSAM